MTRWLLLHQASVQLYLFVGAFAAVALWESFRPRRTLATATPLRWINNFALAGIGDAITRVCLPLLGVSMAVLAVQRGFGLFNILAAPAWLAFVAAVLLIDLSQYALHRLLHESPLLWRMHKIHHAELDVDCVTAVRHHPIEILFMGGAELLVIAVLGAPPLAVLVASMLGAVTSLFNHGNVSIGPSVERALRHVVVTPDMHRIHHSTLGAECNANFSMVFSWWDRLFDSWCASPLLGHESMSLGLTEARNAGDVTFLKLLAMPFRGRRITAAA